MPIFTGMCSYSFHVKILTYLMMYWIAVLLT